MVRKPDPQKSATVKLKAVPPNTPTSAAAVAAPTPKVVAGATPVVGTDMVRKQDFLEAALSRTDVKKRDAKPAMEAALAELVECLAAGKDVHLPPLGKIKVVKSKDLGEGAQVLTLKLRTMKTVEPE